MNDIQSGLLEMMVDIDSALRRGGVNYSLTYGTALGAVRHGGFIPWDDDVDIVILDTDEERFRRALDLLPEGKYFLQEPLSVDWANSFYKIKMNGTTAIEESHLDTRMHQGLFIDVFLARRCPDGKFRRRVYMWLEYAQRGLRVLCFRNCGKPKRDWIQKVLFWFYRRDLGMRDMLCEKDCTHVHMDEPTGAREVFDRSMVENTVDMEFEGHPFRVFSGYDEFLSTVYGDYMVLPPEECRVGKHLIAYDRNLDYRDWLRMHNRKEND